MIPPLRYYQAEQVAAVEAALGAGAPSALVVAATGTGKGTTIAALAERAVRAGVRVLVVAHREEIILQLRDRCAQGTLASGRPIPVGLERAGDRSRGEPIVVAGVGSLSYPRLARASGYLPDRPELGWTAPFGLCVVDEAHHAVADSYRRFIDPLRQSGCPLVGFTATPDRQDGRPLREVFATVAHVYGIRQAQRDGYLAPIQRATAESYCELAAIARGRRTVAFATSVDASRRLAWEMSARGIPSLHVDGEMPREARAAGLAEFAAGRCSLLSNCSLLTEGWDVPEIDVVAVMRSTESRGARVQMVGRGLRPAAGKGAALIVDLPTAEALDLDGPADPLGAPRAALLRRRARASRGLLARLSAWARW